MALVKTEAPVRPDLSLPDTLVGSRGEVIRLRVWTRGGTSPAPEAVRMTSIAFIGALGVSFTRTLPGDLLGLPALRDVQVTEWRGASCLDAGRRSTVAALASGQVKGRSTGAFSPFTRGASRSVNPIRVSRRDRMSVATAVTGASPKSEKSTAER